MIGIKEYNKKIVSLKNTRKMTKTMKMVSAAKFKRAYKAESNALVYAQKLKAMMGRLSSTKGAAHPLMVQPRLINKVLVVVFTSDKGLCGGFNNNLVREVRRWIGEHQYQYPKLDFAFCGRRGYMSLRRGVNVFKYYENITAKPGFADALMLSQELSTEFIQGRYDAVYIAYNRFQSAMSQIPTIEQLLPLASIDQDPKAATAGNYEFEPPPEELFAFLIPKYLNFKLYFTLLENAAGEHGARMTAMDKASSNTSDLIDAYILRRNRARQAAITSELIEIISGAEALK